MKAIIVTGTPGCGKTTFSKKLANDNDWLYFDVKEFIELNKIYTGFDFKMDCFVVDEDKLVLELVKIMKESKKKLVIDSHMSHFIPKEYISKCYVCRCELKELKKRLDDRGYSKEKVKENLEAEIMEVCLQEAIEKGHDVVVVDCS